MEEEALHPLDQLIAAARKADADKSEPVFTVDEKGKMSDYRGKQESTATTRKKNTDVVFKQTSTMPGKGYRKIDGEQLLRFLSQDAVIAGESPDVNTFYPRVANEKGNFVKSKVPLEIDSNALYWWKDDKRMVHSMVDTDLQATLFEAQRSDLQGTGKNVSATGAVRGDEGILIDTAAQKYNVNPKVLGSVVARGGAAWMDPISEVIEVAAKQIGLGDAIGKLFRGEMLGLVAAGIAGLAAGSGDYIGKKMGPAVQNLMLSGYADKIPDPEPELIDSIISGFEVFGAGTQLLPSSLADTGVEKLTGKTGTEHLSNAFKNLVGAFTDG